MTTKKEQTPHEGLFLKIFQNLDNARHFLTQHISEDIQKRLDLDTLRLEHTTYVDEKLKKHYSDLVFSVQLIGSGNQFARIYLLCLVVSVKTNCAVAIKIRTKSGPEGNTFKPRRFHV